jgi:hypothetical protein
VQIDHPMKHPRTSACRTSIRLRLAAYSPRQILVLGRSEGNALGWRGIFRIEDFLAYESAFGGDEFIGVLRDSGCRMLAFGVEHGNESKRHKLKQSESVSNVQMVELFARLKRAGIDTKAYFMRGGWKEAVADIEDTVSFALSA